MITRLLSLTLILAMLTSGCGGSCSFVATTPQGLSYLTGNQQVFGRVLLDRPATGATAELTDLSGNSLGFRPVQVDSSGNFRIPVNADLLPEEFRVRAQLAQSSPWNLPIVANVRGYSTDQAVYCNFLTSAAALYRERKGGTQEQAIAWVRRVFGLPAGTDLGYGVDESRRSVFRHAILLQQANGEGGVAAYLSALVDNEPVNGQILTAIAVSLVADLATDLIGKVAGSIAQALGLNIGNSQDIQELSDQLTDIQNQLSQLNSELATDFSQLQNLEIAEALLETYVTLTTSLEPVVSDIQSQTTDLATVSANAVVTNTPVVTDPEVSQLLSSIAGYDAQTSLGQIAAVLLGENQTVSLLALYKQLVAYQSGIPPLQTGDPATAPVWASNLVLSNPLTFDRYERLVGFYGRQMSLAFNLLVENANLSQDQTIVEEARTTGAEYQSDLAQAGQYLGLPQLSDLYFSYPAAAFLPRAYQPSPRAPSGTVFYAYLQGSTYAYDQNSIVSVGTDPSNRATIFTSDQAAQFIRQTEAFAGPGAGYNTGWRLPSFDELSQLRALALQAKPNDAVGGLSALGYQFPASWDHAVWYKNVDQDTVTGTDLSKEYQGTVPVQVYNFDTGTSYGGAIDQVFDMLASQHCYIEVRYQGFDPASSTFQQIVSSGFRPASAPLLQLSQDHSQVTARLYAGGEDVSPYVVWRSSNGRQLEVEGLGSDAGKLTWHPAAGPLQAQTITGSWQGMDPATGVARDYQTTITVPVPSPVPTRTLTSIVIKPSNPVILSPPKNTLFTATGYYDDHTLADLSQQVTWSLELPDGFPYPSLEATITGSVPGLLVFISPLILDTNLTVKATLGSVVGQTQVEIETP